MQWSMLLYHARHVLKAVAFHKILKLRMGRATLGTESALVQRRRAMDIASAHASQVKFAYIYHPNVPNYKPCVRRCALNYPLPFP